jgi:hypothetical protein
VSDRFPADLAAIREARARMRAMRKEMERQLELEPDLVGPTTEEVHEAEEATEPQAELRPQRAWWRRVFDSNWPRGQKRRRWRPWGSR